MATRNALDVTVQLDNIICHDEGDGPGTAEPYLWPVFYKIDGDTCRMGPQGNILGHATISRRWGNQGNLLNTDVDEGDTVAVPYNLGQWFTRLKPMPVDPAMRSLIQTATGFEDLAGIVGCLWVLMEEDNLPNNSAIAGYNALASAFETNLNQAIVELGILNPTITPEVENAITDAVTKAVKDAVIDSLSLAEMAWQWVAGPDDTLGSGSFRASGDQLLGGPVPYNRRWKNGVNISTVGDFFTDGPGRFISSGGDWEVNGHISGTEVVLRTYEVTCVRSGRVANRNFRIGRLGVKDPDGNFSTMPVQEVMQRIQNGDKFFVRSAATGNQTWVRIHEPYGMEPPNYRHLTTGSDQDPTNNLNQLPQCPP